MAATKAKKAPSTAKTVAERLSKLERANRALERKVKMLEAKAEGEGTPALTPEQEAELDRRIDAYERGETKGVPWEEVRQRLFEKKAKS